MLFLEHKRLYRETFGRAAYPGPEYAIPFGKAKIVKLGTDLTVLTYGAVGATGVAGGGQAGAGVGDQRRGDRSALAESYDWEAIAESVKKTSRVIVAHEDTC